MANRFIAYLHRRLSLNQEEQPTKGLVLVTGASGFVGSHVVTQLLADGYSVRACARGAEVQNLQKTIAKKSHRHVEIVEVKDIKTDDISVVLEGVMAIIHVAGISPVPTLITTEEALHTAIDGTLNVLRHAVAVGIKKVVCTSALATAYSPNTDESEISPDTIISEKSWGTVSEEEALLGAHNNMWIFKACKILTEQAAWKFAEENDLDLATINPPLIYGPFAPHFPLPVKSRLGSNHFMYIFFDGILGHGLRKTIPPFYCDVRDVAVAHVRALDAPASLDKRKKRYFIVGGTFTSRQAVEHLNRARALPNVLIRLPYIGDLPEQNGPLFTIDTSLATNDLQIKEYIGWKKCVNDTIDALLEAEADWPGEEE